MSQFRNFHEGEAKLQAESGVDTVAFDAGVEQPFQPELNESEVRFVGSRTFAIAASLDTDGRPWASPLFGNAGELLNVRDLNNVGVRPRPIEGDPLYENVAATGELGILYFDPSLRRRAKSLGKGTIEADGTIEYRMHRNFGLCNKYIFKRAHDSTSPTPSPPGAVSAVGSVLSPDDRSQLEATDTAFLASHSDFNGTDATHRGGPPGFISVIDNNTLSLPDYPGNGMFQTLGNLMLNDRISLMSVDFTTGRTLQTTGRGSVHESPVDDAYSKRTLRIAVEEVRSSWADIGTWTDIEAFELRPDLFNPATPRTR